MRLNRRETLFVSIGALVLLVLGVYFLIVQPLTDRRDRLHNLTARLQGDLAELQDMAGEFKALAAQRDLTRTQVQARGKDFAPFSFLENLAGEAGLSGRIESMSPVASSGEEGASRQSEFDVRLSGIQLGELVRLLYSLEASDKVFFVVNLGIRPRYLEPDLLDVSLRLATPAANQ